MTHVFMAFGPAEHKLLSIVANKCYACPYQQAGLNSWNCNKTFRRVARLRTEVAGLDPHIGYFERQRTAKVPVSCSSVYSLTSIFS